MDTRIDDGRRGWRRWFRGSIWTYVFLGFAQLIALANHPRLPVLNATLLSLCVVFGVVTYIARRPTAGG
jgi:hypothetical protein